MTKRYLDNNTTYKLYLSDLTDDQLDNSFDVYFDSNNKYHFNCLPDTISHLHPTVSTKKMLDDTGEMKDIKHGDLINEKINKYYYYDSKH